MGDPTTHAIFYGHYWHLCMEADGEWIETNGRGQIICDVGEEQKAVLLDDSLQIPA